jgi:hypothetical protein
VAPAPRFGEEVGRRQTIGLGVLILGVHGYFLWALGAAFGYDTVIYGQLGDALLSTGGLGRFYDGPRYFVFQHIAPGVGLLWATLSSLTGEYTWVVFAVVQHLLAGSALLYLLAVLGSFLPGWCLVLATVLVSFDPIYQSLHNTPMTESIAGSMFLVGIAAAIEALVSPRLKWRSLAILAAAGIVGTQFRSQFALYTLVSLAVLAGARRGTGGWPKIGTCALLVVAGALAWPVYRYGMTGYAFLPNVDYISLEAALRYNVRPSPEAVDVLRALPLPDGLSADGLATNGMSYSDAARIGAHLRRIGFDDAAARNLLSKAARALKWDSFDVIRNEMRLSLLSIGMKRVPFVGDPDTVIHRGFTVRGYLQHVRYWEEWEGGTLWSSYAPEFERFLAEFRRDRELYDPKIVDRVEQRLAPYFVDHPISVRDPLRMVGIPSELWIAGWIGGLVYLGRRHIGLVVLLVSPVVANYAVNLGIPIGNPRYAYPLMPMYTIGSVIFLTDSWRLLRRTAWKGTREAGGEADDVGGVPP